jgi:hypothetical protein
MPARIRVLKPSLKIRGATPSTINLSQGMQALTFLMRQPASQPSLHLKHRSQTKRTRSKKFGRKSALVAARPKKFFPNSKKTSARPKKVFPNSKKICANPQKFKSQPKKV